MVDAELIIHLTEWAQYRELDTEDLGERVRSRIILDGRNALDPDPWNSAGWTVHSLGRPTSQPWADVAPSDAVPSLSSRRNKKEQVA